MLRPGPIDFLRITASTCPTIQHLLYTSDSETSTTALGICGKHPTPARTELVCKLFADGIHVAIRVQTLLKKYLEANAQKPRDPRSSQDQPCMSAEALSYFIQDVSNTQRSLFPTNRVLTAKSNRQCLQCTSEKDRGPWVRVFERVSFSVPLGCRSLLRM